MNKTKTALPILLLFFMITVKAFGQVDSLNSVQDSIWKSLSLDEVTVSAKFLKRKSDGYIVSLQNNPIAKGKDLKKILGYLPGVNTVNGISVNNHSGTLIYIDNRQVKDERELEALQADQIDKVEIKYNTGAAFDARNSGGIIYISMKKNIDKGYYGSLSLSGTVRPKYGWSADYANLPFSFRIGKFSFYNYAWYSDFKSIFEYLYHNVYKTTNTVTDRTTKTQGWDRNFTDVFSTVYDINKKQYIGIYLEFGNVNSKPHVTSTTSDANIDGINRKNKTHKYQATLDYKVTFGEHNSWFNIKADYLYQKEDNTNHYYDLVDTYGCDDLDKQINMFRTEAKLNYNLSEKSSLSIGGEYSRNRTENTQNANFQKEQYQDIDLDANIHADDYAGYISFSSRIHTLSLDAGLRYQADRVYHLVKGYEKQGKTYHYLYPSINLSMPINEDKGSNISLDFSKRLLYLPYSELSPIITMNDAYSYTKGNLNLTPTNAYILGLVYSPNSNWNFTYEFVKIVDDINYLTEVENAEKQITTSMPVNIGRNWSHGVGIDGNFNVTSWLLLYSDLYWYFGKKHYVKDYSKQSINYNRLSYTFQLYIKLKHNWDGDFTFNGETRSKNDDKIMHSVYNLSASINKSFCHNKLVLSLITTPFYSKRRQTDINNIDFASHTKLKSSQTNFSLRLTFRFNSKKNVNIKTVNKLQNIETRTEMK